MVGVASFISSSRATNAFLMAGVASMAFTRSPVPMPDLAMMASVIC